MSKQTTKDQQASPARSSCHPALERHPPVCGGVFPAAGVAVPVDVASILLTSPPSRDHTRGHGRRVSSRRVTGPAITLTAPPAARASELPSRRSLPQVVGRTPPAAAAGPGRRRRRLAAHNRSPLRAASDAQPPGRDDGAVLSPCLCSLTPGAAAAGGLFVV